MINTILVKQVTWKWETMVNVRGTPSNKSYQFFQVKEFWFMKVDTASEVSWIQLKRWNYSWDTRSMTRYITMTIWAFAHTQAKRWELLQQFDALFDSTPNPSWFSWPDWLLTFTDVNNKIREMNCKVVDRIDISDYANETWVDMRVRLLVTDNTCMYSSNYELLDQNRIMWVPLEETLQFPLFYLTAPQIDYQWISRTPLIVTCTAIQDNATPDWYLLLRVYKSNWELNTLYIQNLYMNDGDVLIANWFTEKITLNWFDITGQVMIPYLTFPAVDNLSFSGTYWTWDNQLIADCWIATKTMDVKRQWRDARC